MSVFGDDWRDCLREQYKYVVQQEDNITKQSLTDVLNSVGFSERELTELGVEATMHVDDVPEDFTPDLNILQAGQGFVAHPAECQCPSCVDVNLLPHDEDGQPIEMEAEELEDRLRHAAEQEDDDNPAQLSLF
jgi:hypothetical protein